MCDMKKVFALVLALMLALSLMACSQPAEQDETSTDTTNSSTETPNTNDAEDQEDVSSDNTTITLWTVFTGSDGDILRRIISEYNEANTDGITVEIDIMDNATLQSKLPAAISTGTGPSFVLVGIEYIQQYVDNGLLESIDDFWDVTGIDKSNFYENVLAKSYVDDTLYGVPMQYNLQYLYYNKDAFTDAGLDPEAPPTTLDELQEYAIALTDPASGRYGLGLASDYGYYVQFLWGFGGDVIDTASDTNLMVSDENVEALTWLQNLYQQGVSPAVTAAEVDTMFQSGQVAMCMAGPWNINGLNALGMNYGICAIPAGPDGAYSGEGGCSYMLPKGADDKTRDAVYKFMAYWLSDDVLKTWSMENGFPVWSYSLLEDEEIKGNEILSAVSAASSIGRDWHLGYEFGASIDSDVMKPMIENIFAGSDVSTELQAASDRLDAIIAG